MKKQFSVLKKSFLLFALMFASIPVFSQSNLIVGSWRLTAADKILPDGKQVADYGANPRGIAIFTADGHYVVEIFRSERLKFASGDRAKGTPDEYRDAVMSASCHLGTYTVDETKGTITFHTERASYPNWDETTRVSGFKLEGNKLTWRVPPRPDGTTPVSVFSRIP
ncbi:lipocalin-like domain-containing protein [Mucilaginibacter flavidus]|uniref:lipocalin-like domain-containing protein n=1 Tax=Mucilaginibacter flavidus TaxID=2949309 RepID=UPI0020924B72|nr:lipocalin-like domain-containing protein [Mucilaginibacter flavidus]MCO5949094.1 lipocalin-like domain-containing protein [Mucilaginibacter flavidus]